MKLSRRMMLGGSAACLVAAPAFGGSALVMGTGRPGGSYALYGPVWGQLVAAKAGINVAYRASGGAAADILLIEQNAAQLGMTTVSVAFQARNGEGAWTAGAKFQNFRALFPMFPSVLQIVSPRRTGIVSLAGLAGAVIGIGPEGGSGVAALPSVLASVGVIPARFVSGDYDAQIRQMLAGELSACAFIGAPPVPAIASVAMHGKLSLIGFSEAESAQVARTSPGMSRMILAAGVFPGQTIPVGSVGTENFAIGAAGLTDEVVAAVTLAAVQNRAALEAVVPAAGQSLFAGVLAGAGVPYHPGAVAALKGLGIDVTG
jgi:TRAP transporter TAXI family solute receptor